MARERMSDKQARAEAVIARLDAAMPQVEIELDYDTPLQLLVSVLLAAQTTDKRVNLVTPALFARFPTAADYAASTPEELQGYIKTVGLFRNKAKALVKLGRALVEQYEGRVPLSRALLAELPGVGQKTAGVVSMHLEGGDRAFPVDTHVGRLARRFGFSTHEDPDDVERDLRGLVAEERWFKAHQLLVWHGRYVCHARAPHCHRCVVEALCPKRGVTAERPTGSRER